MLPVAATRMVEEYSSVQQQYRKYLVLLLLLYICMISPWNKAEFQTHPPHLLSRFLAASSTKSVYRQLLRTRCCGGLSFRCFAHDCPATDVMVCSAAREVGASGGVWVWQVRLVAKLKCLAFFARLTFLPPSPPKRLLNIQPTLFIPMQNFVTGHLNKKKENVRDGKETDHTSHAQTHTHIHEGTPPTLP